MHIHTINGKQTHKSTLFAFKSIENGRKKYVGINLNQSYQIQVYKWITLTHLGDDNNHWLEKKVVFSFVPD